jgi:hypothetical protein
MNAFLRLTAVLAGLTFLYATPARALDSLAVRSGTESFEYFVTFGSASTGSLDLYRSRDIGMLGTRPDALDGAGDLEFSAGGDIQTGNQNSAGSDPGTLRLGGSLVLGGGIVTGGDAAGSASISLVPEPQAWLLLAAGFALMQIFRRRGGAHASDHA